MTAPARRRAAAALRLPGALQRPECYPHPVGRVRLLETHISWVLLTGEFAYKIKKPVDFGFADFTTLARRRRFCQDELRLNRRLAPGFYLEVVEIRGSAWAPHFGGSGRVIDYAVKMREFPQEALAARALARRAFGAAEIDSLAATIADFHEHAPRAAAGSRFGAPATVLTAARANFRQMRRLAKGRTGAAALPALSAWTEGKFAAQRDAFESRQAAGRVRECHGDLHLGNIALLDGRPAPFDCIEFNEELRWIDVMNEVAFLAMDLEDRGRGDLAWRFLNRYLEATGDYPGIAVLRFYMVYRALVRAKVHLLRSKQARLDRADRTRLQRAFLGYLLLARRLSARPRAALMLTHGLSGSGKTTGTQTLVEQIGAVRLRSDIERKRLHGIAPLAPSGSGLAGGIYTREATAATYRRLGELARSVLQAGCPVVVDAAFLRRAEREAFRILAEEADVPFLILDFRAPLDVLRERVAARQARGDDASEADLAVLERQVLAREPLTPAEISAAVVVDATGPVSRETWLPVVARLREGTSARHSCVFLDLAQYPAPHPGA